MEFKKAVLASFLALSLVACGDSSDTKEKPNDDQNKIPEKSQECVAAGDRCVLENGQWVIKEEPKPDNDAPVVEGSFDYSDVGITDVLKPERRGFSFYHKGENSKLDKENFDGIVTLSSSISWSSDKKYDPDLFNFVAIRLHDGEQSSKGKPKYVFDKIGVHNHLQQQNMKFFGTAVVATSALGLGKSAFKSDGTYLVNRIPALVNTAMFVDKDGKYQRVFSDTSPKVWWNDEADKRTTADGGGSGTQSSRVYGKNSFLVKAGETLILDAKGQPAVNPYNAAEHKYNLEKREKSYPDQAKHVNFVWYKPTDRLAKAKVNDAGNAVIAAKETYEGTEPEKKFPTDVELGVLQDVQFGRLTGQGINPDAAHIDGYEEDIKPYPFAKPASGPANAIAGNKKAEDWYFARGTVPTPLSALDKLKEAGQPVVYDGMALMFGLDYNPMKTRKPGKKEELEDDKSTNSVMPKDDQDDLKVLETAVLDGKQNFVRLKWDPSNGHVNGGVYGVWTVAQYYRAKKTVDSGGTKEVKEGHVVKLTNDGFEVVADIASDGGADGGELPTGKTDLDNLQHVIDNATRIGVRTVNLVELKGRVVEETNSFGGEAIRCKDGDKGIFAGGFFGQNGTEIAGLINSQTGNMKDRGLTDPGSKWGGSFGAQRQVEAEETLEYLDFPDDPDFNYDTATEVF